jgi:cbb3-type cytochrome oxidase maturation protein
MDILYVLVPLSVVLVFLIVGVLAWSVWSGQFDGIEREGERILEDDGVPPAPRGADARKPD